MLKFVMVDMCLRCHSSDEQPIQPELVIPLWAIIQ
jgi:hypothetical protein